MGWTECGVWAPDIGWQTVTCHTSQRKAWDTGKITALTCAQLKHTAPHGCALDQSDTTMVEADSAVPQSAIRSFDTLEIVFSLYSGESSLRVQLAAAGLG